MADIRDVQDALCDIIEAKLYPNGIGEAGAFSPDVKFYPGWPDPTQLEADLYAGDEPVLHVSVWPLPMERDTTRYEAGWMELPRDAETYAASIVGQTITISGAAPDPYFAQNVAVGIDATPPARVVTAAEDATAAQIAAALAAEIALSAPGTAALGAVITVPAPYRISFARVGGSGSAQRELARSDKGFQVTIWANTDAHRVALARELEPALAAEVRIPLADGSVAFLRRLSSTDTDDGTRLGAFRRDLVYSIEYAVTETVAAAEIVAVEVELQDPEGATLAEIVE